MQTAAPHHDATAARAPGRRAFLAGAGATAAMLACGGSAGAAETAAAAAFPFDARRAVAIPADHPWTALSRRHRRQCLEARLAGPDAWTRLVQHLARLPQAAIGDALHHALRQVAYRSDERTYQRSDVWATPREFLQHGGDCEDFAVAAWLALAECGVPPADLRLTVASLPANRMAHAVTALRRGATVTVFDNRADKPVQIRPFARLQPLYSLSADRLWLHVGGGIA